MSNNYPIAVIPFADLSPSACHALAVAIQDAVAIFQKWRLNLDTSRLIQAQRTLQQIVDRNSYGQDSNELYIAAKAITLASDFYNIARILQDEPTEPMAQELKIALQGTLEGNTVNQSPYNFQSQFWVGSVLAFSNLHPTVVIKRGRVPDFTITVDTLKCNVEVKRPQNTKSAHRVLMDAATQLHETNLPGIIAIDLSAAIGVDEFINADLRTKPQKMIGTRFYALANELGTVAHNYRRSNKFSHIIGMLMFARFFIWTIGEKQDADNGFFFNMTILDKAYSGLLVDQTIRMHEQIARGLERISGNPLAIRYRQGSD